MFRKFALIGILTVLAGCETISGMERDFDKLANMVDIEGDFLELPMGKATKAPEPLPSTMNMQTGVVIQSEQDKADAAMAASQKKATAKPLTPKKAVVEKAAVKKAAVKKAAVKRTVTKPATKKKTVAAKQTYQPQVSSMARSVPSGFRKNPLCPAQKMDAVKDISQLYHFYYKKPKICKAVDYHEKALDVYRLVLTSKDQQDIRLLNADHGFSEFTIQIMGYAPETVRRNGATFLSRTGCGLIGKDQCNSIIKLK